MTAAADHLDQARRNRAFAERLVTQQGADVTSVQWAVVAAFYCALHCIQAHLIQLGHDPQNHGERGFWIDQPSSGIPADVRRSYYWLKQRSESARYRLGVLDPHFVQSTILGTHLGRVTQFVSL